MRPRSLSPAAALLCAAAILYAAPAGAQPPPAPSPAVPPAYAEPPAVMLLYAAPAGAQPRPVLPPAVPPAHAEPPAAGLLATPREPAGSFFTRGDAWFAAASAAGIAAAAFGDRWAYRASQRNDGPGLQRAAHLAEHLGSPVYVGPALLAGWAAGRFTGASGLSQGAARVGVAVLGAGALAAGLKLAAGRTRPFETPDDPDDFHPFSGKSSFPSGHATIAFAAAAAVDGETRGRWVPWLAYPAATAVAWSRVHDHEHWASDVVAGAALGFWAGRKLDAAAREHRGLFRGARFLVRRSRRGYRLGIETRF
ncbi:MAG: phosphatase PAP2 family protein [Candidatus Eisenbacteria bacterium]|nr:phosphatase PAP2 family protein [Candidatus Eisenbacteria bacterium]